jgi:hypothetical protein
MANQDISTDKRLQRKILDRLAMVNVHSKSPGRHSIRASQFGEGKAAPPAVFVSGLILLRTLSRRRALREGGCGKVMQRPRTWEKSL